MMRSNIQFLVQGFPAKDEAFWERLEHMSQKRSFYAPNLNDIHPVLKELQQYVIKQCVVGPNHLAFLLDDGRVCRIQYSASQGQEPKLLSSSSSDSSKDSRHKSGERPPKMPRSATAPWIVSAADLSSSGQSSLRKWGSHIGVIRSMASHSSSTSVATSSPHSRRRGGVVPESGSLSSSSGVRLVRTSQLRGRGLQSSLITGHRVIVPASHVPEELINQVQGILQGKSRSIIVRELQRTSLDVNLAVNNLLSRDDEENDEGDDNGNDYMPGEDLLSLLDSGVNPSDHGVFIDADILPEELLGYTLSRTPRSSSSARGNTGSSRDSSKDSIQERDPPIIRLRSPRFLETRRYDLEQEESIQPEKANAKEKEHKSGSSYPSMVLADEIEWWLEGEEFVHFMCIGSMHSELNAVDTAGVLRQWRWKKHFPYHHPTNPNVFHPRASFLGLESEKITALAACSLRASVLTEGGGVCTWIDESVAHHASVLEHSITACLDPELTMTIGSEKQKDSLHRVLHVSALYSAILTSSGDVYVWGVLPYELRKKVMERAQSKFKKNLSQKSGDDEIKVGSLVHMNNCPLYQAGAVAIHPNNGQPKAGRLQRSVWSPSETCSFKVLRRKMKRRHKSIGKDNKESNVKGENESLKKIEADVNRERETVVRSTGSSPAICSSVYSRKRKHSDVESSADKPTKDTLAANAGGEETHETWKLRDVFFVEDPQAWPVGTVVKVDGNMVAVVFNKPGKSVGEKVSKRSLLKNMRLLKKEEVRLLSSDNPPKMPECFLKKLRKLKIRPSVKLHSLCAGDSELEGIDGDNDGSHVRFVSIDLSGKVNKYTSDTLPSKYFFDRNDFERSTSSKCSLYKGQQCYVAFLRDVNSCLYPLLRNENSGIRDPKWLNLNPVTALASGTHSTTKQTDGKNGKAAPKLFTVNILVFKQNSLMPILMHRNHEALQEVINDLAYQDVQRVREIAEERCDGKRNILHVAVSLTCPTTNSNPSEKGSEDSKPAPRSEQTGLPSPIPLPETSPSSSTPQNNNMSQNERVNAVHAIANAISVVTRNDRTEPRFMRDIMQQFAVVLDESQPSRIRNPPSFPTMPPSPRSRENWRVYPESAVESSLPPPSLPIPTSTWPPEPTPDIPLPPNTSSDGACLNLSTKSSTTGSNIKPSNVSRGRSSQSSDSSVQFGRKRGTINDGLNILKTLLTSQAFKPVLLELLTQRDALGHTPFMSAVYQRGYPAALEIFKQCIVIAKNVSNESKNLAELYSTEDEDDCNDEKYYQTLMSMIYPPKSDLDANPLYLVCVNDTCSFTWTGAQHINQDIYECWTCGLTGSLCCCSECARICHNGHDCKLKRTSPTAYCDCWEKCACRSLIAGDSQSRTELLQKLISKTDLVTLVNSRGETILQFLASTVARQSVEQRQHRSSRGVSSRSNQSMKSSTNGRDYVPQHNLQPPTFSREAFISLLHDWKCVRSTVLSSYDKQLGSTASPDVSSVLLPEEELCLSSQTGTSRLDLFLLCLVVKCNPMYLEMILETFINRMQQLDSSSSKEDDYKVVHGVVRSLVRTFVILSVCSPPDGLKAKLLGRNVNTTQPLKRIQRAFNALAPCAIKELAEMACSLIDPVRLGVTVPTAPFGFLSSTADVISSCEAAFNHPPFNPKSQSSSKKLKSGSTKKRSSRSRSRHSRQQTSSARRVLEHSGTASSSTETNRNSGSQRDRNADESDPVVENVFNVNPVTTYSSENISVADIPNPSVEYITSEWEHEPPEDAGNDAEQDSYVEVPGSEQEQAEGDGDTQPVEENSKSRNRTESTGSQNDVVSEGDLDMDDEDDGQEDGEDNYLNNDDESDMDLTLLAGSDADTDVGSGFSGDENDDKEKDITENRRRWLYLSELSDEIVQEGDDNNQEDDAELGDGDDQNDSFAYVPSEEEDEQPQASDDEENASSQEEDGPNANQDDEEEDANSSHEFPLERASTRVQRSKASNAPQSMRWALGNSRSSQSNSGQNSSSGRSAAQSGSPSGLVYIDPLTLRRNNTSGIGSSLSAVGSSDNAKSSSLSTTTSSAQLARAFGICIREAAKLIAATWQGEHANHLVLVTFLELKFEDVQSLKESMDRTLSEVWKWLLTVIDATEAQLRYGQVLSLAGSPGSVKNSFRSRAAKSYLERPGGVAGFSKPPYSRSGRDHDNYPATARQDFLSYALSLMRGHTQEHGGYLPVVDISSIRHIAYVLDALVFYMRETSSLTSTDSKKQKAQDRSRNIDKKPTSLNILSYYSTDDEDNNEDDPPNQKQEPMDVPDELYSIAVSDVLVGGIIANAQRKVDPAGTYSQPQRSFFRRSESMTFLGGSAPDPFTEPLSKTLPLADRPHLLQPNARKEELFGRTRNQISGVEDESYFDPNLAGIGMGRLKHKMHLKFERMRKKLKDEKNKSSVRSGVETIERDTSPQAQRSASVITQGSKAENFNVDGKPIIDQANAVEKGHQSPINDIASKEKICEFLPSSVNSLLSRCRITMELFTKVFIDDVGAEPGSILVELGGFEVREAKFRKEMEKLRNCQSVDLQLTVERDPHRLILGTFKQLNQHFRRRTGSSSMTVTSHPLAVQRVKVIFKDEPGEGSGVSRSFYTALCEALLSSNPLPPLDEILVSSDSSSSRSSGTRKRDSDGNRVSRSAGKKVNLRSYFMARYAMQSSSSSGKTSFSTMAASAPPFNRNSSQSGERGEFDGYKRAIGDRLYPRVNAINAKWPRKITGILLVQPISDLLMLLNNDSMLKSSVHEASRFLTSINYEQEPQEDTTPLAENTGPIQSSTSTVPISTSVTTNPSIASLSKVLKQETDTNEEDMEVDVSTEPLFYQPGKRGFYSPAAGPQRILKDLKDQSSKTPVGYEARLNAFRNVGRIIGLCLLQNELCPLPMNRHVLKALLGRKINWYDFAFFDPGLYESMRFLLAECEKNDSEQDLLEGLELNFVVDLLPEEGCGQVELMPGGSKINVKKDNVKDYVRRYAIYRMFTCCHKFIEQMRDGLFDVIPQSSLSGLTAEDFRLLLNGCGRVNVRTLISYTSFNDESGKSAGSSADKLNEFKRWFWSVVEGMNHPARQELLYFWTGSPALPASEEGFQPLPTITIRPPDDQHLPTANTCISRLYVPLYSTKIILKKKLMLAIKTKNFGFV